MKFIMKSSASKLPHNHQPPEPKSRSFWGYKADYFRDPFSFLSKCASEYGDIVYFRFGKCKIYFINNPDYIEQVLVTNSSQFAKPKIGQFAQKFLGNGLITSEGDFWHRQRRLMQPAFHRQYLANYQELIVSNTNHCLANWKEGETREICQDMKNLILENMIKIMFSNDIVTQSKEVENIIKAGAEFLEASDKELYRFPEWLLTPARLRIRKTLESFDRLIYEMIHQRRATDGEKGDMLCMLLSARDVDGTGMTDQQVRDEIMTLTDAACETVSMALSWTWYLLSQHPEVEAKLTVELETVLGNRTPTVSDFPQLRYTEMVVMETLRLYPPDWLLSRRVLQNCEIAGYTIPTDSSIFYSQWVIHRDKRFFDEPEVFNPERWNSDLAKKLPFFAYFPFGGGSRSCVAKALAMMQIILVIATIAQKFCFTLAPNHQVLPFQAITLKPKFGLKMLVNKRASIS